MSLRGRGSRSGTLLAFAAGIRMEDDKERNGTGYDAGDDDEQEGAAEGLPLARRRCGGGCHVWFDARCEGRDIGAPKSLPEVETDYEI